MTSPSEKREKSVTFVKKIQYNSTSIMPGQSTQFSRLCSNQPSEFARRKMFNIQNCQFMSLKNIKPQSSTEQSYNSDPIVKLNLQISQMEDVLAKSQKLYMRKIKNLGKKFNKQCEKYIQLQQQVIAIKNQLSNNLKAIKQLKNIIGKQNIYQQYQIHQNKKSRSIRKHRHYFSPFKQRRF